MSELESVKAMMESAWPPLGASLDGIRSGKYGPVSIRTTRHGVEVITMLPMLPKKDTPKS